MKFRLSALFLAAATMAAAAMATIPAVAASSTRLNVPFGFTVGGKQLPAGLYTVQHDLSGNFLKLQSVDSAYTYTSIALPNGGDRSRVVLKFGTNGQTHVLQSIQCGELLTPRLDRKNKKAEDVTPQIVIGQ
jgi:hypothetical protein